MNFNFKYINDKLNLYNKFANDFRNDIANKSRYFSTSINPTEIDDVVKGSSVYKWNGNRDKLVSNINSYLNKYQPCEAVKNYIEKLRDDNTLIIAAGHQPSLFGGPLFLALKIISAIKVCKLLNRKQNKKYFVPLFWNGSEDHNFAEFGKAVVFDKAHDLKHLEINSVDSYIIPAKLESEQVFPLLEKLSGILPDTEFKERLFESLKPTAKESSLSSNITRLMLDWFGEYGLIVIEPEVIRVDSTDIIKEAVLKSKEVHKCILNNTEEVISEGYKPPLPVDDSARTLCYYINQETGERQRIVAKDGADIFKIENTEVKFTKDDFLKKLKSSPECFSPSAGLRPIVQQKTLPVYMYIAGGGELAYHYQIKDLFKFFNVNFPLLLPRSAATVLKKSVYKKLGKYNVDYNDILSDSWDWDSIKNDASENNDIQVKIFESFRSQIESSFAELAKGLKSIGFTNLNELDNEKKRFWGRIKGLEKRFEGQDPTSGDNAKKSYFKVRKFVFPGESYQELIISTVYFISLYGNEFLSTIIDNIDPFELKHLLIISE